MISLVLLLTACLPPFPEWSADDTGSSADGGSSDGGTPDGGTGDGGTADGGVEDGGADGGSGSDGGAEDADGDGWTVAEGDCDDTDEDVHPEAAEICNNGVDDNCNDDRDDCVLEGNWTTSMAWGAVLGESTNGYLGTAARGMSGGQLLVSAPWDQSTGRLYLVDPPKMGEHDVGDVASFVFSSTLDGAQVGQDLAVGDLDGDGHQDFFATGHVAVGVGGSATAGVGTLAWFVPGPYTRSGELESLGNRLADGSPAALYGRTFVDGPALLRDSGTARGLVLGSITYAGADRLTTLGGGPGAVYVVTASDLRTDPITTEFPAGTIVIRGEADERLGSDVAWVDFDGNGVGDLALGAEAYDNSAGSLGNGRVYVLMNDGEGLFPEEHPDDTADRVILPGTNTSMLGFAVQDVGDFDGDGLHDVAVGAPASDWGAWGVGEAAVFTGPTLAAAERLIDTSEADLRILGWDSGAAIGGRVGASLARAGDLDGDDITELLVGAPMTSSSGSAAAMGGGAWIVLGGQSGTLVLDPDSSSTFSGPTGSGLGTAFSTGTDHTGDGVPDVVITGWGASSVGAAWIFPGLAD